MKAVQEVLENFPNEMHDEVMRAVVDGGNLEALMESREGSAILSSFLKTISNNVSQIINLSINEPDSVQITEKAVEIAWCVKQLKNIQNIIDKRNEILERTNND